MYLGSPTIAIRRPAHLARNSCQRRRHLSRDLSKHPTQPCESASMQRPPADATQSSPFIAGRHAYCAPTHSRRPADGVACGLGARLEVAQVTSWDPDDWERYCVTLLRQRHGDALVPVPDKSGGDGGLEAFVHSGTAWQCYAPENEPLPIRTRYALQRDKITADLGKLKQYQMRVKQILGEGTVLSQWILLTPVHESADLVIHCNRKAAEVVQWGLPFVRDSLVVSVQTLSDFAVEHRLVQNAGLVPQGLQATAARPTVTNAGELFADAWGPLIEVMDEKLRKVLPQDASRRFFRGELLSARLAGDDLLGRFRERIPDVAEALTRETANVKRSMLMKQALEHDSGQRHLMNVRADLQERLLNVVPGMSPSNAEMLAEAAITTWLQECSMDFTAPSNAVAEHDRPHHD
jgi:hypothetical protein